MNSPVFELSIVIPTHGAWSFVRRCLDAIAMHATDVRHETIVVDDASPGETATLVERAYPWARAIRNPRNLGFAGSCNTGFRAATAPLVVFLNDDAFAHPAAFRALVDAFDDPSVGAAGARLLYPDGTIQHAGQIWHAHESGPLSRHAYWHLDGALPEACVSRDYSAVTGAVLALRRNLFGSRAFDELYRNGYEDLDLCFRVWARGARVRYVADSVFTHFEGATLGHSTSNRNRDLFLRRWRMLLRRIPLYPLPAFPRTRVFVSPAPPSTPQAGSALLDALVRVGVPPASPGDAQVDIGVNAPSSDIVYATPTNADAARMIAEGPARAIWVATDAQRRAMIAAGCAPARVDVLHLGVMPESAPVAPAPLRAPPTVATYVDATREVSDLQRVIAGVAGGRRLVPGLELLVVIERESADANAFVRAAAGAADPTDLPIAVLATAGRTPVIEPSIFAGCAAAIVLSPSDPFEVATGCAALAGVPIVRLGGPDEFIDAETGWCTSDADLAQTLAEATAAGPGAARAKEARHRFPRAFPRALAARRGAELLRAFSGGVPDTEQSTIGPALAVEFRSLGARIALAADAPDEPGIVECWDRALWYDEARHARTVRERAGADVLVCGDLDDPQTARTVIEDHRARGRRVALYPVRRSRGEMIVNALLRSTPPEQIAAVLQAVAQPLVEINGKPIAEYDRPADGDRAEVAALLAAPDIVVALSATAVAFAAFGDGRIAPVWTPEIPARPRHGGTGLAVDARYAHRDETAFVVAALSSRAGEDAIVTAESTSEQPLDAAEIVIAPRWWNAGAALTHLAAGRAVVVPANTGLTEGPNVATYDPVDAASLVGALDRLAAVSRR